MTETCIEDMAGHVSQSDPTATGDFLATWTKINDVTQEIGMNLPKGCPAHEGLRYEFTSAAELNLDFLAEYPELDVDIDWDNFHSDPFRAQTVDASEASLEFNFNDEAPAEQPLNKTWGVLASQSGNFSSPGSPNHLYDGVPMEQSLARTPGVSASKPGSHPSSYFPDMHWVFSPLQTQFTTAQGPSSASQDYTVDPAEILAPTVGDPSDLFGVSDFSGGGDISGILPGHFELADNPSGLDFLQSLQLIGSEIQPTRIPDVGYSTQQPPHPTGNGAAQGNGSRRVAWDGSPCASPVVLAGSSEPNPTNKSRAVLTNSHRLLKGFQGGETQRQPGRSQIHRKKGYIENSAYTPLRQAPEKWDIFEYTKHGELDPSRFFSAEEITRFLFTHPLHQGHGDLKESQLRLRIHKTPASSAKRFPNKLKVRHSLSCLKLILKFYSPFTPFSLPRYVFLLQIMYKEKC